jgi:hypothetical protein
VTIIKTNLKNNPDREVIEYTDSTDPTDPTDCKKLTQLRTDIYGLENPKITNIKQLINNILSIYDKKTRLKKIRDAISRVIFNKDVLDENFDSNKCLDFYIKNINDGSLLVLKGGKKRANRRTTRKCTSRKSRNTRRRQRRRQ